MNVKKVKLAEAKEIARELYLKEISQKEIARMLRVTETTVSTWATENNWRDHRAKFLSRRKIRKTRMADISDYELEAIHMITEDNRRKLENGEIDTLPLLGKGIADDFSKIVAHFKDDVVTWQKIIDVTRDLLAFVDSKNPDLAKALIPYCDEFIIIKREVV